jgi:hypothetical protein
MVEMEETIDDLEGRRALYQNQELPRLLMLNDQKRNGPGRMPRRMGASTRRIGAKAKLDAAAARGELMEVITSHQAVADVKIVEMETIIADLETTARGLQEPRAVPVAAAAGSKETALADMPSRMPPKFVKN